MDAELLQLADGCEGVDARFDHAEAALFRNLLQEGQGLFPVGLPGVHVAADDADDVGARIQRTLQVLFVEDLDHGVEPLGHGELVEGLQALGLQESGDQEHRIRAQDLALLDLVFLEQEILAHDGHLDGGAHVREVLVVPEVEEAVRRHGDGAGAVLDQALGVGGGAVVLAHLPALGIAPRHLGHDGDPRQAELLLQGAVSPMGLLHRRWTPLLLDFHVQCFEYLDFFQHLEPSDSLQNTTPVRTRLSMK